MEQQFSPGLLYAVAPENFAELHLQDEAKTDKFEWEEQQTVCQALTQAVQSIFEKDEKA